MYSCHSRNTFAGRGRRRGEAPRSGRAGSEKDSRLRHARCISARMAFTRSVPGAKVRLVMSVPIQFRKGLYSRVPELSATFETLLAMFQRARRAIKIFSPYVDPAFTHLLQNSHCPIYVISTSDGKRSGNAVLERCQAFRNVHVRYLLERRGMQQLFQVHAKMVLVDGVEAYLGSANLTDTSLHYNLELGIHISEPLIARQLEHTFDYFFSAAAVPARCA